MLTGGKVLQACPHAKTGSTGIDVLREMQKTNAGAEDSISALHGSLYPLSIIGYKKQVRIYQAIRMLTRDVSLFLSLLIEKKVKCMMDVQE